MAQDPADQVQGLEKDAPATNNKDTAESSVQNNASSLNRSTHLLTWEEIAFSSKEEKEGAMKLQDKLKKDHGIENAPPFEMARFFIGSKCRLEKAEQKYLEYLKFWKKHGFDDITPEQLEKCFKESMCVDVCCNMKPLFLVVLVV